MIDRRKFLERSVLSTGSVIFSSALLQSCTKYGIPLPGANPQPSPIPPLGEDSDIDWNELAKTAVTAGLGLIPGVGEILGGLVGAFWPASGDTPWDKVKDQVDAFVYQKIGDNDFDIASGKLDDLRDNLKNYLQKLDDGTPQEINNTWGTIVQIFVENQSLYTVADYEVMLLPLYAQFSNLYLSLLLDPLTTVKDAQGNPILDDNGNTIITGKKWGMTDKDLSDNLAALQAYIISAISHAQEYYTAGRNNIVNNVTEDHEKVEPFKSTNVYDRTMTMLVLDYMDTWQYYDISKYPNGASTPYKTPINLFTREIYSDPYGNIIKYSSIPAPFVLPSPVTEFPIQITVWGGVRIDAVQLTYPAGGVLGGVRTTPRMGDQYGGSTNAPNGGTVDFLPQIPITTVYVSYDLQPGAHGPGSPYVINTLQFNQTSGNSVIINLFGGAAGQFQSGALGYPKYALSSIYIHGTAEGYPNTSCDCIVFGFLRQR